MRSWACQQFRNSSTNSIRDARMLSTLHSGSLTWKWKIASWKTTFLYKQWVFHFHVSESECSSIETTLLLKCPRTAASHCNRATDGRFHHGWMASASSAERPNDLGISITQKTPVDQIRNKSETYRNLELVCFPWLMLTTSC